MAKFKRDELQALVGDESETLEKVSDTITSKSRWSLNHELVFREKATGRYFRTHYSEGATEQQDESPFEYANEEIEVPEVLPIQKLTTLYVLKETMESVA